LLISTKNEPDGLLVEVQDSSPELASASPDLLFEAFYTTKPGGLWLGLSICRSIMESTWRTSVGEREYAPWRDISLNDVSSPRRRIPTGRGSASTMPRTTDLDSGRPFLRGGAGK
jgi:hypothetical protein